VPIELLQTFLAVVQSGSMRRAATALHLTQPAVSARIRELESRLEARLFERLGRGLGLTAAGRLLADEAPNLLSAHALLERRVRELESAERATLRLATIDAASVYVLPEVYGDFRAAHPQVQLTVQVVESRRVAAAVRSMECDVGVLALSGGDPEATDADLQVVPIFEEELVCVAPAAFASERRSVLALADVASRPLVLYARGSTTRAALDRVFVAHGVEPHVVMETASPEAMKRLVEVGVGWSLLPAPLVHPEVAAGRLCRVRIADARFTRRLATVVRRGGSLPAAARLFLALVHRRYPPLAASPRSARGRKAARGAPSPAHPAAGARGAVRGDRPSAGTAT
jgi:DNA-binding transcriptional LysR family regulator